MLGRNWLREIRLNWRDIQAKLHNVSSKTQSPLNDEHVFNDELGALNGIKASIHLKEDALSRLSLPYNPSDVPVSGEVIQMLERLENTPLDAAQIKQWTRTNPVMYQVLLYTTKGRPNSYQMETIKAYFTRKDEISIQYGCLLWGSRVIVPSRGRQRVLDERYARHPGMTQMKGLARATLWWRKWDQSIEDKLNIVTCVKLTRTPLLKHHYIRGSGRTVHGKEYISIIRDHITINCD